MIKSIADYAMQFIGSPYIWGGDGTASKFCGFDCSGLVLECLWAFGRIDNKDITAQGIFNNALKNWTNKTSSEITKDCILFFGRDCSHISHVAISINNYQMIEAGGGGSKCTNPQNSSGMVRIRPIKSRKDLVGVFVL